MKVRGIVVSGVLRGSTFIEIIYPRLIGLLKMHPYKGTLNVKLEKKVDIRLYSTKAIDHIITDGTRRTDAYLAPIILTYNETDINCWAMRQEGGVYGNDIIEVIYHENLKEALSMKDGDTVVITFFEQPRKRREGPGILGRLFGQEASLMKS